MSAEPTRIVCLSEELFPSPQGFGQSQDGLDDDTLEDLLDFFSPDAIFLVGNDYNTLAKSIIDRTTDLPVFAPGWDGKTQAKEINSTSIYSIATTDDLSQLETAERNNVLTEDDTAFVISNELSLSVDTETLKTSLNGFDEYKQHVDDLSATYCHISGVLPGDYKREWNSHQISGAGIVETQNKPSIPCLELFPDGRITTTFLDSHKLGLQAVDGVGPSTASTLTREGIDSRQAIADADVETLTELKGIGEKTAEKLIGHASALEDDVVLRSEEDPLPGREPVFIDIETDGLTPTIIWEIGVLDSATDTYHDYMVKDPESPGKAITQFMVDVTNKWSDRVFVAWNGNDFDFKHLHTHINRYCPDFLPEWESLFKLDLLYWATGRNNAILPGRTNKLEDVSEALGYERLDTDLTGKQVGEKYRTWMRNPQPENELDWQDHKIYCEHDVRALAAIYNAIEEAEMAATDGSTPTRKQQSLVDF